MISRKTRYSLNLSFFLTFILVIIFALLLALFYKLIVSLLPESAFLISKDYLNPFDVKPEPAERYTFYFFILLFLPLTFIFGKIPDFIPLKKGRFLLYKLYILNPVILLSCLFCFIFLLIFFTNNFLTLNTIKYGFSWKNIFIGLFLLFLANVFFLKIIHKDISVRIYELIFFSLVTFSSFRYIVTETGIADHLDIVFFNFQFVLDPIVYFINNSGAYYPDSLYGNYSFFIAPIVSLFPDQILATSCLLVFMIIACHLFLYFSVLKITSTKTIAVISGMLILFLAGNYSILTLEPYFQYYPIRVIFPSIVILLFLYFDSSQKPKFFNMLIPFCCGLSVIWNMDTGICLTLTFFLIRFINEIEKSIAERGKIIFADITKRFGFIFLHELSITAIVIISFLFLFIGFENSMGLLNTQRNFYLDGFYMLPITHSLNLWMLVLAIYVAGGVYFFKNFGHYSKDKYFIFFLSIFGIGIFAYFQGRSHPSVLPTCIYPAILIFFIFFDKFFKKISSREKTKITFRILSEFILLLSLFIFFVSVKGYLYMSKIYWRGIPSEIISNKVEFIKKNTAITKKVVILSDDSTYLYYLTGKQSYPFVQRTLCLMKKSQIEQMINAIDSQDIKNIFVDIHTSSVNFKIIFEEYNKLFAKKYSVAKRDPSGRMVLLTLKDKDKK